MDERAAAAGEAIDVLTVPGGALFPQAAAELRDLGASQSWSDPLHDTVRGRRESHSLGLRPLALAVTCGR